MLLMRRRSDIRGVGTGSSAAASSSACQSGSAGGRMIPGRGCSSYPRDAGRRSLMLWWLRQ